MSRIDQLRALKRKLQARIRGLNRQISKLKLRPVSDADRAIKYALGLQGVRESSQNRGPQVDKWEREFNLVGQDWCGCLVGHVLRKHGVPVTDRIVYVPYIHEDGKAGRNGFASFLPLDKAKPGDVIVFSWDGHSRNHTGLLVTRSPLVTLEGNTGNPEGVWRRTDRKPSQILGVARPRWKQ